MLNEVQEFKDYTTFPAYESKRVSDTAFLGRFTLPLQASTQLSLPPSTAHLFILWMKTESAITAVCM